MTTALLLALLALNVNPSYSRGGGDEMAFVPPWLQQKVFYRQDHHNFHPPRDKARLLKNAVQQRAERGGAMQRVPHAKSSSSAMDDAARTEEATELRLMTWIEAEAWINQEKAEAVLISMNSSEMSLVMRRRGQFPIFAEQTGAAAIIVPLGATEQHGPNGLIGTDHITAEAVARGVSAATGALLAPTLNFGMSLHHGSFAGTVTLNPATFVAIVRDVACSLDRGGFTHVLFINGHGGNVGPTYKAFVDFKAMKEQSNQESSTSPFVDAVNDGIEAQHAEQKESSDSGKINPGGAGDGASGSDGVFGRSGAASTAQLKLVNWYAGRESATLAKDLYGDEVGQHATPDEVAMTQYLFPEYIKTGATLDPAAVQVAKDLKGMTKTHKDEETGLMVMDACNFRERFPDGRMFSNPGLATPEHGQRLFNAAVRDATEALKKFVSGEDLVEQAAMASAFAAAKKNKWKRPQWKRARMSAPQGLGKGSSGGATDARHAQSQAAKLKETSYAGSETGEKRLRTAETASAVGASGATLCMSEKRSLSGGSAESISVPPLPGIGQGSAQVT